jgi:phage I-like protein
VYLPRGENTISATLGGKPRQVTVKVDRAIADALSAAFNERLKSPVRPHFDFDHAGKGPAAGQPFKIWWDEERGVMASANWSDAGTRALKGRDYSYFSPTFLIDDKGRPYGFPKSGAIGALVNEPAFREIGKIAANHTDIEMDTNALQLAGVLTAAEATTPETAVAAIVSKHQSRETAFADLQAKLQAAEAKLAEQAQKVADDTAERLIKAGKVDEGKRESLVKALLADPSMADLLDAQKTAPDVTNQVVSGKVTAAATLSEDAEMVKAASTRERALALVATGVPYSVAWNRAEIQG